MEKAASDGGFFKFQCPGNLQAAVTPEPVIDISATSLFGQLDRQSNEETITVSVSAQQAVRSRQERI
jgi:hypothetical protein